MPVPDVINLILDAHIKSILLPKQTHPGPLGHPSQEGTTPRLLFEVFKEQVGAAPPLKKELHPYRSSCHLKSQVGAPLSHNLYRMRKSKISTAPSHSPLERGAYSIVEMEEAGCVALAPAPATYFML